MRTKGTVNGDGALVLPLIALWDILQDTLNAVWPPRSQLDGIELGDVWPCETLGGDFVPFHKLTQWLTYSLVEPLQRILGWKIEGMDAMTGLPEYRNGGLFIDLGVLTLRHSLPRIPPSHPAIVEWRALTVVLLYDNRKSQSYFD